LREFGSPRAKRIKQKVKQKGGGASSWFEGELKKSESRTCKTQNAPRGELKGGGRESGGGAECLAKQARWTSQKEKSQA